MYPSENIISRDIITPEGEQEFQLRYMRDENVGVVTTRTNRSFFILDSKDYWYDLIQEHYPPVIKCSCKNTWFHMTFHYTPRIDTEDIRTVGITCRCTACQKLKKLPPIDIDYGPSSHLLDQPLTFCAQPKIKYKTYSVMGYWSKDELQAIIQYLAQNSLVTYCKYYDPAELRYCVKQCSAEELNTLLFVKRREYRTIWFSEERLDEILTQDPPYDIWRKKPLFVLNSPISVWGYGLFYEMKFCSEYLDQDGNIVSKSPSFCKKVTDFRKYSKALLKK